MWCCAEGCTEGLPPWFATCCLCARQQLPLQFFVHATAALPKPLPRRCTSRTWPPALASSSGDHVTQAASSLSPHLGSPCTDNLCVGLPSSPQVPSTPACPTAHFRQCSLSPLLAPAERPSTCLLFRCTFHLLNLSFTLCSGGNQCLLMF